MTESRDGEVDTIRLELVGLSIEGGVPPAPPPPPGGGDPPGGDGGLGRPRRDIKLRQGFYADAVDEAAKALKESGAPVFERAGDLVRPKVMLSRGGERDAIRRPQGAVIISAATDAWLTHVLGKTATWWRPRTDRKGKVKDVRVEPDASVVRRLLATVDDHGFRPLRQIVTFPVLLHDGRRLIGQGYDPTTGILVHAPGQWPPLPEQPTQDDAIVALNTLSELIRGFPFVAELDRMVAVAFLLTLLMRPTLPTAPGFVFDANLPGTGKSLLVDACSIIVLGWPAPVMDYGRDPEEAAKRLDAAMLSGDLLVALDNIDAPLQGATLCTVVSQQFKRIRVLGSSDQPVVACVSVVAATGNNVIQKGDVVRRMLTSRMEADTDRPERRVFDQDLLAEARQRRGELVTTAHTIIAAYAAAGRPKVGLPPLGTFEEWSRVVRDAMVWAGGADPVLSIERTRVDDPTRQASVAVLTAWHKAFGEEPKSAVQAVAHALEHGRPDHHQQARGQPGGEQQGLPLDQAKAARKAEVEAASALVEALELVCVRGGKLDSGRLGYWLRAHRDARVGGLVLRQAGAARTGLALWSVRGDAR